MSVRLNQEIFEIGAPSLNVAGANTRVNQLVMMLLTPVTLIGQRVQIIGGPFTDPLGNPLANGYLVFQLQHDEATGSGQIAGNISVQVPLDVNGFIQGTVSGPQVFIFPNDIMTPSNSNYIVWAYDSGNRLAFTNPQIQRVLSTPSPFNVNAWIPGP